MELGWILHALWSSGLINLKSREQVLQQNGVKEEQKFQGVEWF